MASQAWILLGCTLLAVCFSTEGLEVEMVRRPSNIFCGRFTCFNKVNQDVSSSFSHGKMVVYDRKQGGGRTPLAVLDPNEPNLVITPARASVVNGTGEISKSSAFIRLDFTSKSDCLRGSFDCEMEYVGVKGKKEVITETVTPGEQAGDCTCSSITEQFLALTGQFNSFDTDAYVQMEANADFSSEARNLAQDLNEKRGALDKLNYESVRLNEGFINLNEGQKDTQEDIAAQSRSHAILLEGIEALRASGDKRGEALREQKAKDDANDATFDELKQVDITVTAAVSVLENNDAQFEEEAKDGKQRDDSLNEVLYAIGIIHSKVQGDFFNLEQSDKNQLSDLNDLNARYAAQVAGLNQVKSDFNTQVNQINVLRENDATFRASLDDAEKKNADYDTKILAFRKNINQYRQTYAGLARKDEITGNQIRILDVEDARIRKNLDELSKVSVIIRQKLGERTEDDTEISEKLASLESRVVARATVFAGLRTTDEEQNSRISNLSLRYENEFRRLRAALQIQYDYQKKFAELNENIAELQHMVLASHVTVVTRTTTKLTTVRCARGMAHKDSREQVLVHGVAVLCDTETEGGGYIIVGARKDGSVRFDGRSWEDYVEGFGRIDGNYWVGLGPLRQFSLLGYDELRIDLVYQGRNYYAVYKFSVGDENSNYELRVSDYHGDAGDALGYHSGSKFSTLERDNDKDPRRNCAEVSGGGGWWYNACSQANLHGTYGITGPQGIIWSTLSADKPVSSYEIKIRNPSEEQVLGN